MSTKFTKLFVAFLFLGSCFATSFAKASDYDVDIPEIEIADWQVPGDGITPTFLQYLDVKGFQIKEAKHLLSSSAKGDVVYSYDLELPPALLKPSLTLAYSSASSMNIEMPYGWELKGIVEIRRPLTPAYDVKAKEDWYDSEWQVSGPGFSGTLLPSGEDDYHFYLKSSHPIYVMAKYNTSSNTWKVYANGIVWELQAMDEGEDTEVGTALWRATEMKDASGNYVSYSFHHDGRVNALCYGGNSSTSEDHLVDVVFDYEENAAKRTSARAGFLTTYQYHITKISVQAHEAETCSTARLPEENGGTSIVNFSKGKIQQIGTVSNSPSKGRVQMFNSPSLKVNSKTDVTQKITQTSLTSPKSVKGIGSKTDTSSSQSGVIAKGVVYEESISNMLCGDGWYSYNLEYTTVDSLDLLTRLTRSGGGIAVLSDCNTETIAEFEYSEFDDSDTASRTSTSMAPKSLGESRSHSQGRHHDSTSETTVALIDMTRDGLPEVIDSSDASSTNKNWQVTPQKVNSSSRSFSWDTTKTITAVGGSLGFVTTEKPVDASTATRALTSRQVVDFDGDGYLDILVSGDFDEWVVYYGNSSRGFSGGATNSSVEKPPTDWEYSQVSWAVKADHSNAEDFTKDIGIGMIDFNGDGWLDCYDPAEGSVWLHGGVREAGWSTRLTLTHAFEAMRSVKYTIDSETFSVDVEDYCEEIAEDACNDAADEASSECQDNCWSSDGYMDCQENSCGDCDDDYDSCQDCIDECQDECEDNCDGDVRDDTYDDCMDESVDECKDSVDDTRQKYISATDEIAALYDLNGDGLPDYVDASSSTWQVYLNNGRDFADPVSWSAPTAYIRRVDEGRPDIKWESNDMGVTERESGSPSKVYQMLIDVDGDGLLDLAMGQSLGKKWYKNTGSSFESTSRSLPAWWPDHFMTSERKTEVDGDDGSAEGESETTAMMMDLDHDGAVDYLSKSKVYYGSYPRPYLVVKIENGQGGQTEASYRSLATVAPSGDWSQEQKTPNIKHLVDTIFSIDGFTGQNAKTNYSYENGEYVDGLFHGFEERTVTREINNNLMSKTNYEYELSRDYEPLVTQEKINTDFNLSFGSEISKGAANSGLRYKIVNTYSDYGADFNKLRLIQNKKITEYGEDSGSKTYQISYTWDGYGNLKTYKHNGGGDSSDAVTVEMSYVRGEFDENYSYFFRMNQKTTSGKDPLMGSSRDFATEVYYYDDHTDKEDALDKGLLSKTETWAGWVAGGESLDAQKLTIDYNRGPRGELVSVLDNDTGIKMDQSFGFGGAVLQTQTNALSQTLTRTLDSRGRVSSITDPNGLKLNFTYDAFNRLTKKTVTGTDGSTHTVKTLSYSRSTRPYYDSISWYNDSGSVEVSHYTVQDGFGNPVQLWKPDRYGNYLVTTQIHDLRGLLLKTSAPEDKGKSFSLPITSLSVMSPFNVSYYDAFGDVRELIRDNQLGTGSQLTYHDSPREELRQDEEGYQTKLTYDAHHRITQVEEGNASSGSFGGKLKTGPSSIVSGLSSKGLSGVSGKSTSYTTTATYEYDPLNRLVKFEDAGGTFYTYSYDGAGRLRQVSYGKSKSIASGTGLSKPSKSELVSSLASKSSSSSWYTYEYKGILKTKMEDATGAYAEWEYDELGRVSSLSLSDSLPSSSGTLEYTYEYDGGWIGAVSKITDPSGTIEYEYDEFGHEAKVKRSYTPSSVSTSGKTAEIHYDYDMNGRLTAKTLPSGRNLSLTYSYGHLASFTAATGGATDYKLSFNYNDWNLWSSVTSSLGHKFSRTFTTPLWPDQLKFQFGSTAYQRDYKWLNNSLLSQRTDSVDTNASTGGKFSSTISKGVSFSGSGSLSRSKTSGVSKAINSVNLGTFNLSGKSTSKTKVSKGVAVAPLTNITYHYSYDSFKQLKLITSSSLINTQILGGTTNTIESYTYDDAGNLTAMQDSSKTAWTYTSGGTLNQISGRTSDKGGSESLTYDAAGRVTQWQSTNGTYDYYYDGLGRLRGVMLNGSWQAVFDYDVDGNIARQADNNPFTSSPYYTYEFRDWRYDEKTGVVTEEDNGFVTSVDGSRKWLFHEYDGHVAYTFDDAGTKNFSRKVGGYGRKWSSSGDDFTDKSFHGAKEQHNLFHKGQRHLMQSDGQWLQPEPLLYLGIPEKNLATPLAMATYRYAMNSPTAFLDATGFDPDNIETPHIDVEKSEEYDAESPMELAQELHESGDKLGALSVIQGVLDQANPTGSQQNCVSTSVATALILRGESATAGDMTVYGEAIQGSSLYEAERFFETELGEGRQFVQIESASQFQSIMDDAGSYSSGIVTAFRADGSSHMFNVINLGGNITFIDGQKGGKASNFQEQGYIRFELMTTSD